MKLISMIFHFMKFGRVLIFSYLSVNKWIIYCEKSVLSVLIPEFNGNIPL